MEEEIVLAEDSKTAEESVDLDTTEEQVDSTETTDVDWQSKAEKAEELANNYKIRAEKAEKKAKETVKVETKTEGLSSRDTIALINAKVHEDDVDEVLDYARFKKIPISEALKSSVVKASIAEREELRNTANATNTGRTRSGSSKVSGDSLLEKARKTGEMPDTEDGIKALIDARSKK
jgi:hypothetical protein